MSKLIMLSGLPASGKTTLAKSLQTQTGNYLRVSRDDLRPMLHQHKWSGKQEGITIKAEKALVKGLLEQGQSVIVDDTNLGKHHEDMWKAVAQEAKSKFEKVPVHTPWYQCIIRDRKRKDRVGDHVVLQMALQYKLKGEKVVICDIDGTVADLTHRLHHIQRDKKDWDSFFAKVSEDSPITENFEEAIEYAVENDAHFIFCSGRSEACREETERWLNVQYGIEPFVIMRRANDHRPDTEVKKEMYDKYFKHQNVLKVFDDRPCVIRMWRGQGLDVVDVGDGIEF